MEVLEQVRATMARYAMVQPGQRVLVAVSGGPDSLALLHALHALAPQIRITLHVYSLDHGLRGAESAADAAFVAAQAQALGLPCTTERVDAAAEAARQGLSLQTAARKLRYERLAAVAAAVGAERIATGHNREDQAETVLLRLLRGAGTRGLAGIPPVREARYIRPLLRTSRADIEAFLAERGLMARQDPSNRKPAYLRNRIRLELLPLLRQQYNPRLTEALAETAERLRHDADYLDALAAAALQSMIQTTSTGVTLNVAALREQPQALAARILRQAAAPLLGPGHELSALAVDAVLELAAKAGHAQRDVGGGVIAYTAYGRIGFRPHTGPPPPPQPLALPGEAELLGLRITTVGLAPGETPAAAGPPVSPEELGRAAFAAELLPGPLAVRTRRPGDRIYPVGMSGSQKLQDLFTNCKVVRWQRDAIAVLVAGDAVLWVPGYRVDRRWSLPPDAPAVAQQPMLVVVAQP